MKGKTMTVKETTKLIIVLLSASLLIGCAKESAAPGDGTDPGTNPIFDPISGGDDFTSTGTSNIVSIDIVGNSVRERVTHFEKYTGRSMYDPQNIKLEVSLEDRGDFNYGGALKVTYTDNGSKHTGIFVNGDDSYYLGNKNEKESAKYNKWFQINGKWVFHGFFQDDSGAVILVLDGNSGLDLGDGPIKGNYKGSLWYKNFSKNILYTVQGGPHPRQHCWFVWDKDVDTAYDCQAWKTGNNGKIDTYKSLYPDEGYVKLGDFEDLDINSAFGIN